MRNRLLILAALASALALGACGRNPLLVKRSSCPAVAIPDFAGQLTSFDPAQSRNADAIDFTAQISDISASCVEGTETLLTDLAFTVTAQRRTAGAARQVYLPLFVTLVQGGNVLVSKQITGVELRFADGQLRAEQHGGARAEVHRSAVALPADIQERITRDRRPDEQDALIDPLADPRVREAVRAASFEILVGFQLDDPSLAYNLAK